MLEAEESEDEGDNDNHAGSEEEDEERINSKRQKIIRAHSVDSQAPALDLDPEEQAYANAFDDDTFEQELLEAQHANKYSGRFRTFDDDEDEDNRPDVDMDDEDENEGEGEDEDEDENEDENENEGMFGGGEANGVSSLCFISIIAVHFGAPPDDRIQG